MGLAQAIGAGLGLVALIGTGRRARDKSFRAFVVGGLIVSTLMITPLSKVVWDTLPLLPLTQFPWRFLSVQALFASLAMGYLIPCNVARRPAFLPAGLGLALAAATLLTLAPDYLPIRADEITPARLQLYEAFTGNIGTTIRAEYLPRATVPRPYTGPALIEPARAIVSSGTATATPLERHAIRQAWAVTVNSDQATINLPVLYWPGWAAWIDGQPTAIRATPDLGYIQIDVPPGEHRVDLELGRTPLRLAGELISLLAGGGLLLMGRPRGRGRRAVWGLTNQIVAALLMVIGCGLLAGLYRLTDTVPDTARDLTMDFAAKPWLHHNPGGVDFGSARLIAYNVTVGEHIQVHLDWQTTASPTATVSLVAPSAHFMGGPSPLVEQTQPITAGLTLYDLRPPYALPTGWYYLRVTVAAREEYLTPIWIKPSAPAAAAPTFGQLTPAIGLAAAHTRQLDRARLDVLLSWSVTGAIDANYGISLRLNDAAGQVWTSLDTQPGYGFQPTSAWPSGLLNDAYTLNLPPNLPRDQVYALDVILYRVASQQEVGRATLAGLRLDELYAWRNVEPPARNFGVPPLAQPLRVTFGDQIRLLGYAVARDDRELTLTLAWQALRGLDQNYRVFVHLFDPATETIVVQSDAMPRHNTYATSRWISGEVVTDTIVLPLAAAPPGSYRIAIGLFDAAGRLPVSGSGADGANRRVVLAEVIEVR